MLRSSLLLRHPPARPNGQLDPELVPDKEVGNGQVKMRLGARDAPFDDLKANKLDNYFLTKLSLFLLSELYQT